MNYIKSNIGFIISMILLSIIAFNPDAKSFVLKGLIKLGLYEPQFTPAKEKGVAAAPSAVFRSADGELIDIADSKGKVIFLNFWAAWCPPCLAEMPSINNLANHFRGDKNLVFLMANIDGELQENFFEKKNYNLPAFVPASPIPASVFEGSLPTTVIVNKEGRIVYKHEGIADYNSKETREFIERLLRE
jgi:thiol-disulfide isomerase/thioredoxin